MESCKVLIVSSDFEYCELTSSYLRDHNYAVDIECTGRDALSYLKTNECHLILLGMLLPDFDGFEVCRQVTVRKDVYGEIPIIFVSHRNGVFDRIVGLESGADDYIQKPFSKTELLARIQNVVRWPRGIVVSRHATLQQENHGLTYYREGNYFSLDGEVLNLTRLEYELLQLLCRNSQKVLCRDEIINTLSGIGGDVYDRAVDSAVYRLRTKLKDKQRDPKYIRTVWGDGYRYINTLNIVND